MTAAIEVLLGLTAWTMLLAFIYVGYRTLLVVTFKQRANAWTRDAVEHEDPAWIKRIHHAHLNSLETLPLYAGVVLGAYMLGQVAVVDEFACVFLIARLAQSVVHAISTSPIFVFLRANALIVQWALLVYWLCQLCGLA